MATLLARFDDPAIERGLFHDIGISRVQFYPARRDAGEMESIKKLMTAVLVDALQCYQTGRRQAVKRVKALEACAWIFGNYADFPFSFTNVCAELGLSPDHIKKQLRDSDPRASEGGRPKMIRRPAIRTLKAKGEACPSQRLSMLSPSMLRIAKSISGFRV